MKQKFALGHLKVHENEIFGCSQWSRAVMIKEELRQVKFLVMDVFCYVHLIYVAWVVNYNEN